MKSERGKSGLNMLLVAVAAMSLAACAMEMEGDEELWSEEGELTADESVTAEEEGTEAAGASDEAPTLAGSCSTSTENGGHTAVGRCSGYMNTGTFRVVTTCCLTSCFGPIGGPWAFLAGGTSKAGCGSAYASNVHIEFGPAGG